MLDLAAVLQSWWSWSAHSTSTDFCDLEDKARHVEPVRSPPLTRTLTDSCRFPHFDSKPQGQVGTCLSVIMCAVFLRFFCFVFGVGFLVT